MGKPFAKAPARSRSACDCFVPSLILEALILVHLFYRFRLTILLTDVLIIPVIFSFYRGDLWVPGESSCEQIVVQRFPHFLKWLVLLDENQVFCHSAAFFKYV